MEQLTDDARKKRYGQYFSGKNVANTLVSFLPESATIKNVIDPMVGSGDMLVAVSGKITSIQKVCGVDIDSQAIATCRKRIPNAEVVEGSAFITDEVLNGSGWDLVITNPPYVRYQLFNTNDEYGLPTGDEVRRNLKDIILRASLHSKCMMLKSLTKDFIPKDTFLKRTRSIVLSLAAPILQVQHLQVIESGIQS